MIRSSMPVCKSWNERNLTISRIKSKFRCEWRSAALWLYFPERQYETGAIWLTVSGVWPCRPTGSWTVMQPLMCQLWTNWSRSIHELSHCSATVVLSHACACACVGLLCMVMAYYFPRPGDYVFAVVPPVSGLRLSVLEHFSISCQSSRRVIITHDSLRRNIL